MYAVSIRRAIQVGFRPSEGWLGWELSAPLWGSLVSLGHSISPVGLAQIWFFSRIPFVREGG
jgi:hypothetical protein